MDPSLGARLRAQRERQQVALGTISNDTKIKLSILEGLERDDVSQWPDGIYRRAYVRAYARAIGLDPETLVREFLDAHPDPVVVQADTHTELENPQWPAGIRRLVTSAIGAVPSRRHRGEGVTAQPVQPEPESERSAGEHHPGESGSRSNISLPVAADLCARLGHVSDRLGAESILEDAARTLDAVGLVVWRWDTHAGALRPWITHGYSDATLARMPKVRADADNAVAAVFRSGRADVIDGGEGATGAVVVPLMAHSECVGVLAVELQHGDEQREAVRAFATVLAAPFVSLVVAAPLAEAVNA